jgi:hypothetical protein
VNPQDGFSPEPIQTATPPSKAIRRPTRLRGRTARPHSLVPVLCASISVRRSKNGVKSHLFANSDQFCGLFFGALPRRGLKRLPATANRAAMGPPISSAQRAVRASPLLTRRSSVVYGRRRLRTLAQRRSSCAGCKGLARTPHRVWILTACRRHSWSVCTQAW